MSLSRIYAIFIRQLFLMKSNPTRLVAIFIWLILSIIQWGFISRYLGTLGQATFGFITVILGAIIMWEFMTRIQHGVMMAFLEDVWTQNLINYFASPLKIYEYLAGLVSSSLLTGSLGILMMTLLAGIFFSYSFFKIGLMILPFLLVLFLFGMAMGFFITAVIFRLGPSAEWLGWPIPMVLSIFTGVFYPISSLPVSLQLFAKILPPAYVFESLRSVMDGGAMSVGLLLNLLLGLGLALIYLLLAYGYFIRVYRHNLKTGGIARFGAESAY